jgi:hypothetical protein
MTEITGRERERLAKKQIDCPSRCLSAMILTLYQLLGGDLQTRPRDDNGLVTLVCSKLGSRARDATM